MLKYEIESLCNHTADDVLIASVGMINYVIISEESETLVEKLIDQVVNDQNTLLFIEKTNGSLFWLPLKSIFNQIINDSGNNMIKEMIPCICAEKETKLSYFLQLYGKEVPSATVPPSAIYEEGKLIGFLTPFTLLHYLFLYEEKMTDIFSESTSRLDWFDNHLPLYCHRERAANALNLLLHPNSIDVLGLVERRGYLIGDITLIDFLPYREEDIDLSLREYMSLGGQSTSMVTCGTDSVTIFDLVRKMLTKRCCYAWKLDCSGRPKGLIHLSHIFQHLQRRNTTNQVTFNP